jgi:nickel/cobalt transporter (NicO) family protein
MRGAVTALFVCLMLFALDGAFGGAAAQGQRSANPFGGRPPAVVDAAAPATAAEQPASAWRRFRAWSDATQQQLHRSIAKDISVLGKERGVEAGLLLIAICFGYGVLHALGPGHGKAVISSYVVASERTVRRGIALSFAAALAQALTAIAIAGALVIGVKATSMDIQTAVGRLESASYVLIAVTGCWLLFSAIRRRWSSRADHGRHHGRNHEHEGGGACSCGHAHVPDAAALAGELSPWRAGSVVLAVGIRPCTGALLALVFALQQGILWAGVLAVIAMSLGTAITVSTLVAMAVGTREAAVGASGRSGAWAGRIYDFAAIGGALLLVAMGVTLFVASLGPARPFL